MTLFPPSVPGNLNTPELEAWARAQFSLRAARRAGTIGGLIFSLGVLIVAIVELVVVARLGADGSPLVIPSPVASAFVSGGVAACAFIVARHILWTSDIPRPGALARSALAVSAIPTGALVVITGTLLLLTSWMTQRMQADGESLWSLAVGACLLLGLADLVVTPFVSTVAMARLAGRTLLTPRPL